MDDKKRVSLPVSSSDRFMSRNPCMAASTNCALSSTDGLGVDIAFVDLQTRRAHISKLLSSYLNVCHSIGRGLIRPRPCSLFGAPVDWANTLSSDVY